MSSKALRPPPFGTAPPPRTFVAAVPFGISSSSSNSAFPPRARDSSRGPAAGRAPAPSASASARGVSVGAGYSGLPQHRSKNEERERPAKEEVNYFQVGGKMGGWGSDLDTFALRCWYASPMQSLPRATRLPQQLMAGGGVPHRSQPPR